MVQKMRGKIVKIFSNSRFVVGYIKGKLEASENARVFESSQALAIRVRVFHLTTNP